MSQKIKFDEEDVKMIFDDLYETCMVIDEFTKKDEEEIGGMNKLGFNDLIIGK